MHLTEEGNRRIAEALIQPVLEILQRLRWTSRVARHIETSDGVIRSAFILVDEQLR